MLSELKTLIALGGVLCRTCTEQVSLLFVFGRSSSYMVNPGLTSYGSASYKLVPERQSGLRIFRTGHQTLPCINDADRGGPLVRCSCLHLDSSARKMGDLVKELQAASRPSIPTSMASEQPGNRKQGTEKLIR